jgi:hypothetical protein
LASWLSIHFELQSLKYHSPSWEVAFLLMVRLTDERKVLNDVKRVQVERSEGSKIMRCGLQKALVGIVYEDFGLRDARICAMACR